MSTIDGEKQAVLESLGRALDRLTEHPIGALIPEVRSNLGFAIPAAASHEEVAAIPGRLTHHDDEIFFCRPPAFGASRHVARVILSSMHFEPTLRAAMNIRFSPLMVEACRSLGLRTVSFDRTKEPSETKQLEGRTLEWGTEQAFSKAIAMSQSELHSLADRELIAPNAVYDEGDVGKEPMIRVLGRDPEEVVDTVIEIYREWRRLSDATADPRARRACRSVAESPVSAR